MSSPVAHHGSRTHFWTRRRFTILTGYLLLAITAAAAYDGRRAPEPLIARLDRLVLWPETKEASATRVFVLFQAHDCSDHLNVFSLLNEVNQFSSVRVVGFGIGDSTVEDLRDLAHQARFDFPVYSVKEKHIHRSIRELGYVQTPIVLVADARGQVRSVSPGGDLTRESLTGFLPHLREDLSNEG